MYCRSVVMHYNTNRGILARGMEALLGILGVIGILLFAGLACGLADSKNFSPGWLFAALLLVLINDALLTNLYGLLPDAFPQGRWNWQGKLLALLATLAIAAHPRFGWRRTGLTLRQEPGSLRSTLPVALAYCAFYLAVALAFPGEDRTPETVAFQLTMPSLEEEPFYRGLLLLALYEAFRGRARFLGVEWSWGALLSCIAFGLAHAFSYGDGSYALDPIVFAMTFIPSALAVWIRLRTRSLLLPIVLHSFGNTVATLV